MSAQKIGYSGGEAAALPRRFLPWAVVFKQKIFYIFVNNFPKSTFSPQF
jgi:hypothetical protein